MKLHLLAGTVLTMGIAVHTAQATVYYNSTIIPDSIEPGYADGVPDGITFSADSFTASSPNFTQISLTLSANTPGDGGSTMVYLVGDNGSGGSVGIAGAPKAVGTGVLIGTIKDSSLSATPALFTINLSPATDSSIVTSFQEYWVELVYTSGSALWWYGTDATDGIGLGGQEADDSDPGIGITPASGGVYDMVVSSPAGPITPAPEPGALAILGVALLGLGYVRRRSAKTV